MAVARNSKQESAHSRIGNEDRFRQALDFMGDGIWDWDLRTGEVLYSDRWLESLGYDRADVSPDLAFVRSITHVEDKDILSQVGTAHIEGRTDYFECEYRLRKKTGEYRWTLGRGRVLERDENGLALRILGVNFDITAGKTAELALEQAEQRCRIIVETAGSVIICLDPSFRVLEWNRAAEEIHGWTREEARGKNYVEWFLPESVRASVAAELERVFSGGESENYEYSITTRDGSERLLVWNSDRLVNSEGKTFGVMAIAQDITEQKHAERQRELVHREMQVVLERFEVLRGLLRVCSVCKKIRDQAGSWSSLDEYLQSSVAVKMTHGYCPTCLEAVKAAESF